MRLGSTGLDIPGPRRRNPDPARTEEFTNLAAVRWCLTVPRVRPGWGTCAACLPPLDTPGCFGRRNCNVNLDNRSWDRPDLDCEAQKTRGIPRILQVDETVFCPVRVKAALSG